MTLDGQLIREAKNSFGEEFRSQVAELGYNLAYGITTVDNSFAIAARIQSEQPIPEAVREQIEGLLPKQYSYNGHEIAVELEYMSIPRVE